MSLLERFLAARRSAEPRDPEERRFSYSGRTTAGVRITPDNAGTVAAVWACLRYLSQTTAVLPWHVVRDENGFPKRAEKHPVDWLVWKRPNPEWSSFQFRETMVRWAHLWGNGYAEIERDQLGRPYALWPIQPWRVDPVRNLQTGGLEYEVDNERGTPAIVQSADMFHIRGAGDGPVGISVVEVAAESIGWAKAAQTFGAAFFGNGMNLGGVIETEHGLEPAGKERLERELDRRLKGPLKALKWPILDAGMTAKPFQIEPNKGQFVETMQHQVEDACRWFNVPPHKIYHLLRSTNNNIEHQSIEVVQDSILPWAKRFEDEADAKLFGQNRAGFYTKINLRGLLRGDFKSQQEGLEVMRKNGAINANEWRATVDMGPLPEGEGGDLYVMQSQNVPLTMLGQTPERGIGDNGGPPLDDEEDDTVAIRALEDMAERMSADVR